MFIQLETLNISLHSSKSNFTTVYAKKKVDCAMVRHSIETFLYEIYVPMPVHLLKK